MVTLVGTQNNFDEVIIELIELEYDAIEAYKIAISKLDTEFYKDNLNLFLSQHEEHLIKLKNYAAKNYNVEIPTSGDVLKGTMAKMKVKISGFVGSEKMLLIAMLDNEKDTNTAYERVLEHPKLPEGLRSTISQSLIDERSHKKWLEDIISQA